MAPIPEKALTQDTLQSSDEKINTAMNGTRPQQRSSRHLSSKEDSHPTAGKARRRATAYTAEYTPSPHLVEKAKNNKHDALDEQIEKRSREKERQLREMEKRKEEIMREKQRQESGHRRRVSLQEERPGRVTREKSFRRKSTNDEAKSSSQSTRRASSFHASSSAQVSSPRAKSSSKHAHGVPQNRSSDSQEMTEQQIAEYAGKRAMLRLEQEFTDAFNDRKTSASFHSAASATTYNSVMDRRKLSRVPQVSKSDLIIGEYLGRGNFCDVFEVEWAMKNSLTGERLNRSYESFDDDSMESEEDEEEATRRKMEYLSLVCSNDIRPEIIGTNKRGEIDADAPIVGSRSLRGSFSQVHTGSLLNSSARNLRDPNVMALKCLRPAVRAQPRKFVIGAEDLAHETALLSCLDHPNIIKIYGRAKGSFATAFQFGSSKVSVSSGDSGKKKERKMNDGYFIILDKLTATLDGTIDDWKDEYEGLSERLHITTPLPLNVPPPECNLIDHLAKRIKVAYSIASALEYLHSRHVVFRDLKPANVGFDCNDCVKMFDFGFATSIAPLLNEQIRSGKEQQGYGPLTETCGTRRYMAPEVALKLGYGKEVDVYSFGMLLWEICAMEKPFDSIQSVEDFHDLVVLCGNRPPLNNDPLWTRSLKELMTRCWSTDPYDRPDMSQVKSMLCIVLRDMNIATMKLKQLRANQARASGKNDENGRSSRTLQEPRHPQQSAGFLNKFRRRASIA